jgi:integrase/recombinase XerD
LHNSVIVPLSTKAGLRAGEIANLTWEMVLDASGGVSGVIELRDAAAKKCSGRSISIHQDLTAAPAAWAEGGGAVQT